MNAVSRIAFNTPAAGYDRPLQMWLDCHQRIARMNALLQRLVDHLRDHPIGKDAKVTAASIRRYFDEAAPRHHDDEEIDLFPRLLEKLRAQADPAAGEIAATIESLLADHREMHDLYQTLRAQLLRIEAGDDPHFDEVQIMLFVSKYRAHIEIEDGVLAPALKRVLRARDLKEVGRAMAARRGIDWDQVAARMRK